MTGTREQVRAVLLAAIMVVSVFGMTTAFAGSAAAQSGGEFTAEETTIDADFVGVVDDGGTVTVEATGIKDAEGTPVNDETVTVTIAGEAVATPTVTDGEFETQIDPTQIDVETQEDVEVNIAGVNVGEPATVDLVHETTSLDEGYNLVSIPQPAALYEQNVDSMSTWDPETEEYTDISISENGDVVDTPGDLHRGFYVDANADARLGFDYETDGRVSPGAVSMANGWHLAGSNFDIDSERGERTLDVDLGNADLSQAGLTAYDPDLSSQISGSDTISEHDTYWLFVENPQQSNRNILGPNYDVSDREGLLGVQSENFDISSVNADGTDVVEGDDLTVTATVENTGDAEGMQQVELRVDTTGDGTYDTVADSETVTLASEDPNPSTEVTLIYTTQKGNAPTVPVQVASEDDSGTAEASIDEITEGSFSGAITDDNGEAVTDTQVAFTDDNGDELGTVTTDSQDGSYTLENVGEDSYTVTASADGYEDSASQTVEVIAGEDATGNDFTLTEKGSLTGTVTDDSTDDGVDSADVTIYEDDNDDGTYDAEVTSLTTDTDGTYSVDVAPGEYE
ncbi:carboxypeptidase regulatory-like domain-containing protein, partial [Natrinema sp. JCM 9743]